MSKRSERHAKAGSKRGLDRATMIMSLFRALASRKFTLKQLAAASGGADRQGRYDTKAILEDMISQGVVERLSQDKYRLASTHLPTMEGVVDMLSSGSLYIKVEGQDQDIYVPQRASLHALHGDKVKVVLSRKTKGQQPTGEVVEIVERNPKNYVGIVELFKTHAFVRMDSRKMPMDIFIPKVDPTKVKNGDKVLVHIKNWAEESKSPEGEIIDVFGPAGDNNAEMHAILAEYDLPYKFEKNVEDSAEKIPSDLTPEEFARRKDMRDVTTFTIDPADAKDFDDALSIRKLADGLWEIGVHIADVSHYVLPNTIVDTEAQARGTSVYLVDRTVPMLPERLSNELCSLRPNEEKLTFSAIFKIDADAKVVDQWLGRTVIRSDRRYAYEEAQAIIEGGEGDFKEELLVLNDLAQKMRAARFKNGSVSFERSEAKFNLDENGKPLGVYFKVQKEANQLIEEFMLLANRKVAEFVGKNGGKGANPKRTMVYRVHDEPNEEKLEKFKSFILKFGYYFSPLAKGKGISKELNKIMDKIKGKSEENLISTLAVRSMAKAFYSTDNIGHYGLAFSYYTHFTSPIRRYPDMMVHRLLANYLAGGKSANRDYYERECEHSSEREVVAAEAERASIKYKMVEFMVDKLGQIFDGHISGVTEWGVYVELDQTHIEGMVALREMKDDFYYYNEQEYAVIGHASGRKLTLGDSVQIEVLRADLARKQLDFGLAGVNDNNTESRKKPKAASRRKR